MPPINYTKPTLVAGTDHKTDAGSSTKINVAFMDGVLTALEAACDGVDANETAIAGKVSTIADPNADRLRGWDDSANAEVYFQVADGLAIAGTFVILDAATGVEAVAGTNSLKAITPDAHRETWGLFYGINTQTGTTYAPVLDDQGKYIELSNTGAITVTMPSNATTAFQIGTILTFSIVNTGMATFVAGSGATLNVPAGLTAVSRGQYSTVSLIKRATNTWIISGDLAV